jgi:hypothetical protein
MNSMNSMNSIHSFLCENMDRLERLWFFFLGFTLFFICVNSGLIVVGAFQEGKLRVGIVVAFSVALGYSLLFLGFLIFIKYLCPYCDSISEKIKMIFLRLGIIFMIMCVLGFIAMIVVGCFQKGDLKIGLVVGGAVAIFKTIQYTFIIMVLFGMSVARN